MVSLEKENAFYLRDYYFAKVTEGAGSDPFKSRFLSFLGLSGAAPFLDDKSLSLYQRCTISGLSLGSDLVPIESLSRLLGQSARVESTPMPWVSDVFGVMAVKWLVEKTNDNEINQNFTSWINEFLSPQANSDRFNIFEKDVVAYISSGEGATYISACIPLFLHYQGLVLLKDHQNRQILSSRFMGEFKEQLKSIDSTALVSLMIYVFDKVNEEAALAPPNGWMLNDLIKFLERVPVGLKRWTWEETGRTKNADPVVWIIENEYHVQNLLYVLLAPIFDDISDEIYLQPLGQKTPRIDLYLPSMHTIIEVKYRKNSKKSFQALIGEVAEDVSLYRADPSYKGSRIVSFLWDHARSTQEHAKFKEGVMKIQGMDGCVVVNSPSVME